MGSPCGQTPGAPVASRSRTSACISGGVSRCPALIAAWQATVAVLKQMKLLTSDVPADKLYTNRFVDELTR